MVSVPIPDRPDPGGQATQDRLEWEAWSATVKGRLEYVRWQLVALKAEAASLGGSGELLPLFRVLQCMDTCRRGAMV
jgi:hypothetical protein